jgi:cellulose synthase/poly-beta-1,6-N-acetylglucosamine synthase-like glycosyltransferase
VTGWLIQLGVIGLWVALFAQVFLDASAGAWSVGFAYTCYNTALQVFVLWQTRSILKPPPGPVPVSRPTVAVLIAAYNEAAALPATLRALLAQRDPPETIVVADDGSDDDTAAVLDDQFGLSASPTGVLSDPGTGYPTVRWIRLPRSGKASALNAALTVVDTDLVITMDADTLAAPDAFAAIRHEFATTPDLVVAGGVVTPVCGNTLPNRMFQWFQTYEYVRNFIARYAWMRVNSLLLISGAFAAFRRDAVLTVGGFDPDCLVEDYELIHRMQRYGRVNDLGWQVRVVGRAVATTDAPGTVGDFVRQRRRWFGGFLQTQYWYREMVGNRRYGWLGLVMLPVKAADTMEPIYGLSAVTILVGLVATGHGAVLVPVGAIVLAKLMLDLVGDFWTVRLYRRWTGLTTTTGLFGTVLAAILDPFTFTPLRHLAAVTGWWQFLSGRQTWTPQRRDSYSAAVDQ